MQPYTALQSVESPHQSHGGGGGIVRQLSELMFPLSNRVCINSQTAERIISLQ